MQVLLFGILSWKRPDPKLIALATWITYSRGAVAEWRSVVHPMGMAPQFPGAILTPEFKLNVAFLASGCYF